MDKSVEFYGVFGKNGSSQRGKTLVNTTPSTSKYGWELWQVNVDIGKSVTHNQLGMLVKKSKGKDVPNYIHFSKHPSFSEEFFRQLTAETLEKKRIDGRLVEYWSCGDHTRNEATDTTNYSMAALDIYSGAQGVDWQDCIEFNKRGGRVPVRSDFKLISEGERA